MTSIQQQAEQQLLAQAQLSHETIRRLIEERDAYSDALVKIEQTRLLALTHEEKFDRAAEIAIQTLAKF